MEKERFITEEELDSLEILLTRLLKDDWEDQFGYAEKRPISRGLGR